MLVGIVEHHAAQVGVVLVQQVEAQLAVFGHGHWHTLGCEFLEILPGLVAHGGGRVGGRGQARAGGLAAVASAQDGRALALAQQLFDQPGHVGRFTGAAHPQVADPQQWHPAWCRALPAVVIQPVAHRQHGGIEPGKR